MKGIVYHLLATATAQLSCDAVKSHYQQTACCDPGNADKTVLLGEPDVKLSALKVSGSSQNFFQTSSGMQYLNHVQDVPMPHEFIQPMYPPVVTKEHLFMLLQMPMNWTSSMRNGHDSNGYFELVAGVLPHTSCCNYDYPAYLVKISKADKTVVLHRTLGEITGNPTTDLTVAGTTGTDVSRGPLTLTEDEQFMYLTAQGNDARVLKLRTSDLSLVWEWDATPVVVETSNDYHENPYKMREVTIVKPNAERPNPFLVVTGWKGYAYVGGWPATDRHRLLMSDGIYGTNYGRSLGYILTLEDHGDHASLKYTTHTAPKPYAPEETLQERSFGADTTEVSTYRRITTDTVFETMTNDAYASAHACTADVPLKLVYSITPDAATVQSVSVAEFTFGHGTQITRDGVYTSIDGNHTITGSMILDVSLGTLSPAQAQPCILKMNRNHIGKQTLAADVASGLSYKGAGAYQGLMYDEQRDLVCVNVGQERYFPLHHGEAYWEKMGLNTLDNYISQAYPFGFYNAFMTKYWVGHEDQTDAEYFAMTEHFTKLRATEHLDLGAMAARDLTHGGAFCMKPTTGVLDFYVPTMTIDNKQHDMQMSLVAMNYDVMTFNNEDGLRLDFVEVDPSIHPDLQADAASDKATIVILNSKTYFHIYDYKKLTGSLTRVAGDASAEFELGFAGNAYEQARLYFPMDRGVMQNTQAPFAGITLHGAGDDLTLVRMMDRSLSQGQFRALNHHREAYENVHIGSSSPVINADLTGWYLEAINVPETIRQQKTVYKWVRTGFGSGLTAQGGITITNNVIVFNMGPTVHAVDVATGKDVRTWSVSSEGTTPTNVDGTIYWWGSDTHFNSQGVTPDMTFGRSMTVFTS